MLYQARFDSPVHSMLFLPTTLDSEARTVLVGFGDGVVRALLQCLDAWRITAAFKPHSGATTPSLTPTPDAYKYHMLTLQMVCPVSSKSVSGHASAALPSLTRTQNTCMLLHAYSANPLPCIEPICVRCVCSKPVQVHKSCFCLMVQYQLLVHTFAAVSLACQHRCFHHQHFCCTCLVVPSVLVSY